jgi:ubiquinone/menaquinone biosynthesis C-methylase UbiE
LSVKGKTVDWTREYFGDAYLEIYSKYSYNKKEISAEADFVCEAIDLRRGDLALDLACGFGKHIPFFVKKGIRTIGLDLSLSYLKFAAGKTAKSSLKKFGLVRGDMRCLPFRDESFHAAFCLFNSFGYFPLSDPDPHVLVLKEIRRILYPEGLFFLEIPNKTPVLEMIRYSPQTLQCGKNFLIHEMWDYDKEKKILYNRTNFNVRGKQSQAGYEMRLFTQTEIKRFFKKAGLKVVKTFGDYDGSRYSRVASPHLLVIAKKEISNHGDSLGRMPDYTNPCDSP